MSHTVHPYSHRVGVIRDWKSRWFAHGTDYVDALRGDVLLREYLVKRLRGMYVSGIHIERNKNEMRVVIHTSRPGLIIGRSGEHMTKLRAEVDKEMRRLRIKKPESLKLDVEEVRVPEADAAIVAAMIAEGLERRLPFRRVMKQTMEKVMMNREVKGARIVLSGRLGGAEMSRKEELKKGGIPLQTFRADIDFARERAHLPYGDLGIKVWIYRGEVFADEAKTNAKKGIKDSSKNK